MTLIPVFACEGGFVIHADSQETCGAFRRTKQKIVPDKMGQLDVIIAGSGIGALIDAFTAKLKTRLDADNASDIMEVKRIIEHRLPGFLSNEVANYPCDDDAKLHKFIVAAYSRETKQFAVWASSHDILIPVTSYELAGHEDNLYDFVAKRLYRPNMTFAQAILAGLYVLIVAKATSNYVDEPYHIATVSDRGIELEKQENVRAMTERLNAYEQQINDLFISCANTRITVPEFEDLIDSFKRTASALHQAHIDQQATRTSLHEILDAGPLLQIRGHIVVRTDGYQVVHDRQTIEESHEMFRRAQQWAEEAAPKLVDVKDVRLMQCTNAPCDRRFWGRIVRTEGAPSQLEGDCPACKMEYRIPYSDTDAA